MSLGKGHGKDDGKEKQVSEAGGAATGAETELGGADAVPDKTSGSATGARHEDD